MTRIKLKQSRKQLDTRLKTYEIRCLSWLKKCASNLLCMIEKCPGRGVALMKNCTDLFPQSKRFDDNDIDRNTELKGVKLVVRR